MRFIVGRFTSFSPEKHIDFACLTYSHIYQVLFLPRLSTKRWHFLGLLLVDFVLSYLSHFELFMVQWKHVIQII